MGRSIHVELWRSLAYGPTWGHHAWDRRTLSLVALFKSKMIYWFFTLIYPTLRLDSLKPGVDEFYESISHKFISKINLSIPLDWWRTSHLPYIPSNLVQTRRSLLHLFWKPFAILHFFNVFYGFFVSLVWYQYSLHFIFFALTGIWKWVWIPRYRIQTFPKLWKHENLEKFQKDSKWWRFAKGAS